MKSEMKNPFIPEIFDAKGAATMPKMNQQNPKNDPQEPGFLEKLRSIRVNRVVFLTVIIILVTLSVVLMITAIANRARRQAAQDVLNPVDETPADNPKTQDGTGKTNQDGEKQSNTEPKEDPKTQQEEPKPTVPTLSLPVENGTLLQAHSLEIQVFSRTMQDYRVHTGIDLATEADAPVLAAADGTVTRVWDDPMMGKCLTVSHAANSQTTYKNLAADLAEGIAEGASVLRGQRIGTVGETAMAEIAEEPHLHLEMTVNGEAIDPLNYFPAAVIASISTDTAYEDAVAEK